MSTLKIECLELWMYCLLGHYGQINYHLKILEVELSATYALEFYRFKYI